MLVRCRDDDNLQPFDPKPLLRQAHIQHNHLAPVGPVDMEVGLVWQVDMEAEEAERFNQAKFAICATNCFVKGSDAYSQRVFSLLANAHEDL